MNNIENKSILVSTSSFGAKIEIQEYIIDSHIEGKTVYIQGGIHGGEVTLPIIRKLCDFLSLNLISGKVIFVPFASPISWSQKSYCYTTGKFNAIDGKDFNRCFGKSGDINCKVANCLLDEALKCDFAIDLHTAMQSSPYTIFSSFEYLNYIKLIGLKFNYFCPPEDEFEHTFDIQLAKHNVPNVVIECGSHDEINKVNIDNIFGGIINLLKSFNMVSGKAKENKVYYFDNTVQIKNEVAGIIDFSKDLNDEVKVGDEVFRILVPQLNSKEIVVKSNVEGIIYRISKTHICEENTTVVQIIEKSNFKRC